MSTIGLVFIFNFWSSSEMFLYYTYRSLKNTIPKVLKLYMQIKFQIFRLYGWSRIASFGPLDYNRCEQGIHSIEEVFRDSDEFLIAEWVLRNMDTLTEDDMTTILGNINERSRGKLEGGGHIWLKFRYICTLESYNAAGEVCKFKMNKQ